MRLALAVLLLLGSVARADSVLYDKGIQKNVPEDYPSKSEISAHFGFQLGFGGKLGDTSGAKITGEYAYRFQQYVWFDVQATQVFGFGARTDPCANSTANNSNLCYRGGWSSGLDVGVKVKIPTKLPVVIEIPVLLGINGLYDRECGDDGVAVPTIRTGAGVKYFIKRWVGVGANIDFDLGPAIHQAGACHKSYTDFYGTFDLNVGAEFIL